MKYYKIVHSEIIQRFNKDWNATDSCFFEVDENNYPTKKIQKTFEGKIYKHDKNNFQDQNGGLAEGALNIDEYTEIATTEFYELWDKKFSNTYLVKQLVFDSIWKFDRYTIDFNKTEQELYDDNLIIKGSYKDIFLVEVAYLDYSNYLMYNISEGRANIKYGTVDNWDELVSSVQLWIDYIEKNADKVYSKPAVDKLERLIKVLVNGVVEDAIFTTYRNMDKDIEKFRGAYLSLSEGNFEHINTYIGVEDLMIDLQKSLPENIKIQSCFFCRYSSYNVAGNGNFGNLNCFKHCKDQCVAIKSKDDMIDLWQTEYTKVTQVEETFYCDEFEEIQKGDYVFKSQVN